MLHRPSTPRGTGTHSRGQYRTRSATERPKRQYPGFACVGLTLIALALGAAVFLVGVFRWLPAPTSSFMLQRHLTSSLGERACERIEQRWVDWEQISPHLAIAVLAAEGQRFPNRFGFDFRSIADTLEGRLSRRRIRGASTISQQVAKNLFLWPGAGWVRIGIEAF